MSVHKGDIGTVFEATVTDAGIAVNVSTATTKEIVFIRPDGTRLVKTAAFSTDGVDGKLKATSVLGDISQNGLYHLQVNVTMPTGSWSSDTYLLDVGDEL